MFTAKPNASNAWKDIVENARFLREGVRTEVGNGKRTLFWYHNWATTQPLCSIATSDIPPQLEDATVAELWDTVTGWKWELFTHCLPEATLKIITSNELKPREENKDQMVWTGSSYGNFSLKSVIAIIRREVENERDSFWDLVWQINLPHKINFFLWLVAQARPALYATLLRKQHYTYSGIAFWQDQYGAHLSRIPNKPRSYQTIEKLA